MATVFCSCGAKYRVEDHKLGRTARCSKCGHMLLLRVREEETEPIPLAEASPLADEIAAAAERSVEAERGLKSRAERRFAARPEDFGYAPGEEPEAPGGRAPRAAAGAAPSGRYARFFKALGWNFFLIANPHNVAVILGAWIVMGLLRLASFSGFLFIIGFILVNGWYCAFLFNTIGAAANGEDDLPKLGQAFEDLWEGAALPLFRYFVCWVLSVAPVALCVAYIASRVSQAQAMDLADVAMGAIVYDDWSPFVSTLDARTAALASSILLGLFLWPMMLLVAGLGGLFALVRVDLIAITIARTFPAYLATVVMIYGAFFLSALGGSFLAGRPGTSMLALGAVMLMVSIYLDVVAMRAIGLYYHHLKDRFAWSWG
ncbi:MAG: hypothetical protein FLDDKLPJ_01573 [Phycisphaerae bacterium]|nr:hypothetical protein [Phycisphaerae bacterium]